MRKETLIACVCIAGITLVLQNQVFAETTTDFGTSEFIAQSDKIQKFLFGPAMRIVGIIGGAYGLIQAIMSSTVKPLIVYGGLGLGVNLIPTFINNVFNVSGMMVP